MGVATPLPAPGPSYLAGRLGFASQADLDEFVTVLAQYERAELTPDEWRTFRLVRGVYGQRQPETQMLRIKIPEGVLSSQQLRRIAAIAQNDADGVAHVTTRQNIQLHFMPLRRIPAAMRSLAEVGLTTREACGHSVRNITCCPLAGVDPSEVFDTTPYADATSRFLLRGPLSSTLPRKFKVAFEGCGKGCVQAAINDMGFVARLNGGRRGFHVLAGGGLSTLARQGGVLVDYLPAGDLLAICLAVLRVFNREGNRKNKHKARLKWVIEKTGFDGFRAMVERELEIVRTEGVPTLPFDAEAPPIEPIPSRSRFPLRAIPAPGFADWQRDNVLPQKQQGFAAAYITLPIGDARSAQLEAIADLSEQCADGFVRTTNDQNMVLRYVPVAALPVLHQRLVATGLGSPRAATLADVTSCPGADTCNIAVTASRGLGVLLTEHLAATRPEQGTEGAHVKISGCPNGCGQHHLGTIGFQGGLRKVGGKALPVYLLTIGGGNSSTSATFGRLVGKLPARRGPAAIDRLLALWRRERASGELLSAFYARVSVDAVRAELSDLFAIDDTTAKPEDFIDLSQQSPFEVAGGESECAGG